MTRMFSQSCIGVLIRWCLMAFMLTAAADNYQLMVEDGDELQKNNDFVTWSPLIAEQKNEEIKNHLIIMKLVKMFQDGILGTRVENADKWAELADKGRDIKKWWFLSSDDTNMSTEAPTVQQPKWKTKKGEIYMCYFKVCSFRTAG